MCAKTAFFSRVLSKFGRNGEVISNKVEFLPVRDMAAVLAAI